jgi:IclR family transcriptional regulator, pca regulon regulatory protein
MPRPIVARAAADTHDTIHTIDPADLIAGLGRGFAVVESFDDDHWRMTIADVAVRTGIPRSATRRYLLSLAHFGYADTDGKHFWLTPRVLRLGQGYLDAARLPRLVRPFIQQLATGTGETVNVSVLDGNDVVYIARSTSPRLVSIGFHAGTRAPAHVVSPGTVLLATLKDGALLKWAAAHDFGAFTPNTVTDRDAFIEQVRRARLQDHWIADGQLDPGLTGIAVPLRDRRGRCVAAIGLTVQRVQWSAERIVTELLPALQAAAQNLRQVL